MNGCRGKLCCLLRKGAAPPVPAEDSKLSADNMPNQREADRRFATRYRLQFGIGALLLAVLTVPSIVHSNAAIGTLRNVPAMWLPEEMPIRREFFRFIEDFSVTDVFLVTWPSARLDDPSIDDAMNWLAPLSSENSTDLPRFASSEDTYHASILRLSDGDPPFQWVRSGSQIVERLRSPPLNFSKGMAINRLRGSLVGMDGQQTCLMVSFSPEVSCDYFELLSLVRQGIGQTVGLPASDIVLVGGIVDGAVIDEAAIRSIVRFAVPSSAIAAILCVICLRSLILSGTIIAVAMIAQGMVLAMLYYIGYDLNAILIILPSFVFVLTISAGIHLSNYFREALAEVPATSRVAVVRAAMAWGYKPCAMSAFTTVVGLLSLLLVRVQPVQMFGMAAAIGLLFSLGMLLLMLPGAMLLVRVKQPTAAIIDHPTHQGPPAVQSNHRMRRWFYELPLRRRGLVFAVFGCLSLAAASGLPQLRSSIRVPDMFAERHELNRDYQWFEQHIGPTLTGEVLIAFDRINELDPLERLDTVKALHGALTQVDGVGGIHSGLTFLPPLPRGSGVSSVSTRAVIRSIVQSDSSLLHEMGFLHRAADGEVWRLTFRLLQTEDTSTETRMQSIDRAMEQVLSGLQPSQRPRLTVTGHVVIVHESQRLLLEDLIRSLLAALLVIVIFMSVMVGNPVGGLLSMIPNMMPTVVLFGMMGWCQLPLDIGSVMTASVAIGIAVDDSLHLLSHFRAARRRGFDRKNSAREALNYCGLAMLQTTLICGCSLAVYYASEFKPTQRFAIFMGILLTMAWLGVTLLLPAMMTSRMGRWLGSR